MFLSLWWRLLRHQIYWNETSRWMIWHYQELIHFCFSTRRTFCSTLDWMARAASCAPSARRTRPRSWDMAWSGRSLSSSSREWQDRILMALCNILDEIHHLLTSKLPWFKNHMTFEYLDTRKLQNHVFILITECYFRPSKSPYWNRMSEYINAEVAGREGGDCRKFEKDCAKSLYKLNKYS